MSLTSIITGKEYQEIRDKFKTVFPRPNFNVKFNIIAPPLTTNNASIIGQAFDYLLRFYLQYKYKEKVYTSGDWVADKAFGSLYLIESNSKSSKIAVGNKSDILINRKKFLVTLMSEYLDAKVNHDKYLESGEITEELIKSCLFLARLDVYYRCGMIDPNIGNESNLDVVDIQNIFKTINPEDFHVKKYCYINPNFGKGSSFVQGADADLIIDGTLIDIKVTKYLKLEREHLNQTIGYYILSMLGGINKDENAKPIKNIGIYFARYGYLWKSPLSSFADEQTLENFKDWFHNYINQKLWNKRHSELKKSAKRKTEKKKQ